MGLADLVDQVCMSHLVKHGQIEFTCRKAEIYLKLYVVVVVFLIYQIVIILFVFGGKTSPYQPWHHLYLGHFVIMLL